jgi:molecular chaperone DnaJ
MKDYYAILEVSPMSTRDEIKRQYRKLAKQFHPDANGDDAYAAARFHDIKEAYETLTQPARKEEWLKERWLRQVYHQGNGEQAPLTPFTILEKVLKVERSVASMDVFRMDHLGVVSSIEKLVSNENLECLKKFNEPDMNRAIIRHVLLALHPIPYSHTLNALTTLEDLAGKDGEALHMITSFRNKHRKKQNADRWTVPVILLATLLICLLIWFSSRP